jgi:hypothetical protein
VEAGLTDSSNIAVTGERENSADFSSVAKYFGGGDQNLLNF